MLACYTLIITVIIINYKTIFQIPSYEDSLKSNNNHQIEIRTTAKPYHQSVENIADHRFHRRASFSHQPFDHRRFNFGRQSFSENIQKHFPPFERIGSGPRMTRQISTPNVSVLSTQPYFLGNKKAFRRKEALNEPMIDYDQSDGDDHFDVRINRRASTKHKRGKLMELGGQAAVFVATPAAAELMRRQGSERFMFARPL
ncbi:hypothetical protein JYU34_003999 [Plutella xylostella]|uniref:Uncharacterized protein n=1 Tax=Plutella xylostella TaxID=51655 RepID=A0ABQ7QX04_PLUXY|nr:hypothetical protein JYU34_003999 [Plutella xylostella]